MKTPSEELLELLDKASFSYAILREFERKCSEFSAPYSIDTKEHAFFSALGLAAFKIAEQIKATHGDHQAQEFLVRKFMAPLRATTESGDLARLPSLIALITSGEGSSTGRLQ